MALEYDLLELADDELKMVDGRQFMERTWRSLATISSPLDDTMSATNSDGFTSDGESDDDSVTSEGEVKMILTADSDLDSDTDDEMDFDYVPTVPPPAWCYGFIEHWGPEITLRPRAHPSPIDLLGLSPVPNILTSGHMRALGFREIKWDE